MGQRNSVLGCDEHRVCSGQGVGAKKVLLDPTQPRSTQRRRVQSDQRLEAGIGRLGDKHRADCGGDVLGTRGAFACMRKGCRKARPRMNLKDEFGQIEPGKQRLDRSTQRDQARRFVDLIQGLKREVCSLVRPDDRDRGVGRILRLARGSRCCWPKAQRLWPAAMGSSRMAKPAGQEAIAADRTWRMRNPDALAP